MSKGVYSVLRTSTGGKALWRPFWWRRMEFPPLSTRTGKS